jgi:hypothetical protein
MKDSRALEPEGVIYYIRVGDARSSARSEEIIGATRVYTRDKDKDILDYTSSLYLIITI